MQALQVHKSFAGHSKHATKRFPLLRHHWPLVKKLGTETWDRSVEWLQSHPTASTPRVADVLFAMALLRPVDGADVLKHLLAARQSYIINCLLAEDKRHEHDDDDDDDSDNKNRRDPESVAIVLGDITSLVCTTIAQCGELFSSRPGVISKPLLLEIAGNQDLGASELFFDPDSTTVVDSPDVIAWRRHQTEACERLSGLSAAGVGMECRRWLEALAPQLAPLCEALLRGCTSGPALHQVEVHVGDTLAAWRYIASPSPAHTRTHAHKRKNAMSTGNEAGEEEEQEEEDVLTWSDACQWVVGQPVALWPLLLESPLVARAKGLVSAQFEAVGSAVGELIQEALQESLSMREFVPGTPEPLRWSAPLQVAPEGMLKSPEASAGVVGGGGSGGRGEGAKKNVTTEAAAVRQAIAASIANAHAHDDPRWWLPKAEGLLSTVDENLSAALTAALAVTNSTTGSGTGIASTTTTTRTATVSRAVVLQPYVQETCSAAVESMAAALAAATASLAAEEEGATSPGSFGPAACAALFIGRVAQGLAERSAPLRLLLGPPSEWGRGIGLLLPIRAGGSSGSAGAGFRSRRTASNEAESATAAATSSPRLEAAQRRLSTIATDAYSLWAIWASRGLAEQFIMQSAGDRTLSSDTPLRGWEEALLLGGGGGGGGGDVKFLLPASPSPAAMNAAMGVCREIERSGGSLADFTPVQLVRWHVAGTLCAALHAAFSPPSGPFSSPHSISEKGLLQLLFDLRFLTAVLEAKPPSGMPPTTAAARQREIGGIESELAGHIDPIDWATYESHLYGKVGQFIQRSKTVLGLALRGAPPPKTPSPQQQSAPAATVESNILRMAPAGTRFAYLPVNTPMLRQQQQQQQQQLPRRSLSLSSSSSFMLPSIGAQSQPPPSSLSSSTSSSVLENGEESQYSFASLSTTGGGARTLAAGHAPGGALPPVLRESASSVAATGVGAAAMEALRSSTLGSLLGDKATEMGSTLESYTSSFLTSFPSFSRRG